MNTQARVAWTGVRAVAITAALALGCEGGPCNQASGSDDLPGKA
jgi:hypothetical protein